MKYTIGDIVRIAEVDEDGLQGRDPHPEPEHVGQVGYVVGVGQVLVDEEGPLAYTDGAEEIETDAQMYFVRIDAGTFELANYEMGAM